MDGDECIKAKQLSDEREFAAGFGAAFINICFTFPLNKIMFRQMVHGVNTTGAIDQLKTEGLKNLYRGLLPPLMSKTVSVSIMFGSYSKYRSILRKIFTADVPGQAAIAAFLAGSTEALLCPFERTQMVLQSRDLSHNYNNTVNLMVKMSKFGIKEYYRGMTAILVRNGPSNIIFFSTREYLQKNHLLRSNNWYINLVNDFMTGAVLGAFISTLFYPINVIRTKMQTVNPGSAFISIPEAASLVYHERGKSIAKIYYGVSINCTRALISWGIINASYEILKNILYKYQAPPIQPRTPTTKLASNQSMSPSSLSPPSLSPPLSAFTVPSSSSINPSAKDSKNS